MYHSIHMEVRGQCAGVGFLLLSSESQGSNSGCLTLPSEPSYKAKMQKLQGSCPSYAQGCALSVCRTRREGRDICETSQFSLPEPVDRETRRDPPS